MDKKVARGILQGDSLSPLLFVLCIDPLSRRFNEKYPKMSVKTDGEHHTTNHLLFIGETLVKIKAELAARAERLCKTKLNAKNLFKALNEIRQILIGHICSQHAKSVYIYRDLRWGEG